MTVKQKFLTMAIKKGIYNKIKKFKMVNLASLTKKEISDCDVILYLFLKMENYTLTPKYFIDNIEQFRKENY